MSRSPVPLVLALLLASCTSAPSGPVVRIAHLGRANGDPEGLAAIQEVFAERNRGYGLAWHESLERVARGDAHRIFFVQRGEALVTVDLGSRTVSSMCTVGDMVLLRPGESLRAAPLLQALAFEIPAELPPHLPTFVRPDWNPRITDTLGGCATEAGAYRRILVTWLEANGPYVFHALNAHRVRIMDSFSHYHPELRGFDELYLVQMVQPEARLLTSDRVEDIVRRTVEREEAADLIDVHHLSVGDLVFIPRGIMHRGLGGVLAQVITVPGFRPGAEIGLDHHLLAINAKLGLEGDDALPYNVEASAGPIIR
ncbi:MAG: hypothetical protein O7B99_13595 [Planctomycetota bacterium]|nr:hypothetical protein [Planctomycetota bacterium]